jgi:hypothetical protein
MPSQDSPLDKSAIRRFAADDRKLVAFTNGSLAGAQKQLSNAGISKYFTAIHSADEIQRYKPSLEAYEFLAKKLGVGVSEIMLVAAHDWDITGASWAGLQTAFIEREQPLSTITPTPTLVVRDLLALADQLQSPRAASKSKKPGSPRLPTSKSVLQSYAVALAAFFPVKHSRQSTGRPCVGLKGTVVSLPQAEHSVRVSTRGWTGLAFGPWIAAMRFALHVLQRLGSFLNCLS